MTKTQRIEYINKVHSFFENARNHGRGNNWWYPQSDVIAYNVKMYASGDTGELRKYMTKVQNEYYTDEQLQDFIYREQEQTCELLLEDIKGDTGAVDFETSYINDAYFAGRSGGWVEVEYNTSDLEELENDADYRDVLYYYKEAKKLEALEVEVSNFIEKEHAGYNKYVDTAQYYKDIVEMMMTDDEIQEEYKDKAEYYQSLAKAI